MADPETRSAPEALEPFVRWLDLHGAVRFAGLADQLCSEIPALGTDTESVTAMRASVLSHLGVMRQSLLGVDGHPALPREARDFARRMATRNTPLSAVLRSYELGHAAVWNAFTDYLRGQEEWPISRRATVLEDGSVRLFAYMQAMTGQTIEVYNAIRDEIEKSAHFGRSEIVREVLAGSGGTAELEQLLGYRVDDLHIGYVARSSEPARSAEVAEAVRREMQPLARQHLAVSQDPETVHGWFTPIDDTAFAVLGGREPSGPLRIAFGSPRRGHTGFIVTHQEALLVAGSGLLSRRSCVLRFPDVAVTLLASRDSALMTRFVDDHLGPLIRHDDAERLIDTLRLYLDSLGSPRHCGRVLGVHPNTVIQRVQRAEVILGRPVSPSDLSLRVALHLIEMTTAEQLLG
ncbi:PucR family transcriptional regulator [Pseudonocardia saturnea]|uniref:Uncharacterized protein n=3 Tax=Pseudonocardia TaxID=1847 RepID=A0A1Y2MR49_PSEAH|nr:PucR family transcriptional regulator [Pseudonocardia saturnea]OSY36988.1 hypothetical protein BG845_05071 [Pseudonocardia autotrophica]TDN75670.1 PucR-like helix-turn-helix protein [Pseudonocardia autotrophica]BBF99643.1 hypothetical protein Pdca_08530 [Pseudonocardia autotrophica]GEC27705.1 hypothetical protein PSA01_47340 [Pseudonocardia saturnea]